MSSGSPSSFSGRKYKIPPIPTKYKNRTYRCRLEAKWAVFFDGCLAEARYEAEGYDVYGRWYLPDFYLPEHHLFIEIKPDKPTNEELHLASRFRTLMGGWIAIFHGLPGENEGILYAWDSSDSGGGEGEYPVNICSSSGKNASLLWFCSPRAEDIFRSSDWEFAELNHNRDAFIGPMVSDSMRHAIDCRFEHGADPTPPWIKSWKQTRRDNGGPVPSWLR